MKILFFNLICFVLLGTIGCCDRQEKHSDATPVESFTPALFLFEVRGSHGVGGIGYRIVSDGDCVLFYEFNSSLKVQYDAPVVITPGERKWREFFYESVIDGSRNQHLTYEPLTNVHDGTSWMFVVLFHGNDKLKDIVLFGNNAYPNDFSLIVRAVSALIGRSIGDPTKSVSSPFMALEEETTHEPTNTGTSDANLKK